MEAAVDMKKVISENLNRMMSAAGKDRKDVCKDLDVKYTTFCDWANGNTYPRMEALVKLSEYFNVHITEFFVEKNGIDKNQQEERIMSYASKAGAVEVDLWLMPDITDEQFLSMRKCGIRFKHHSFEEIINRNGGELSLSGEFDWGEPRGREIW